MENHEVAQPIAKAASAWAIAGISMDQIASTLAAIYTLGLLGEWVYKKCLARGWLKSRQSDDATE